MRENLAALRLFVRVARTGSFSRAGSDLGLSQQTASRIIAGLEKELGVGLFSRTTRAVTLSEAGAEYLARVEPILDALEEANHIASGSAALKGLLRIGMSSSFAYRQVIPRLPVFVGQHPELRLDLLMSDQRQDLVFEGADVVLRLGKLPDSSAVARKITTLQRVLVASPSYVAQAGTPGEPEDLASHRIIAGPAGTSSGWTFTKNKRAVIIKPDSSLTVSANEAAVAAALAGLGIAVTGMGLHHELPEFAEGSLVRLLPDWIMEALDVHAVYATGRSAKPAARIFTDFLIDDFRRRPEFPSRSMPGGR